MLLGEHHEVLHQRQSRKDFHLLRNRSVFFPHDLFGLQLPQGRGIPHLMRPYPYVKWALFAAAITLGPVALAYLLVMFFTR